MPDHRDGTRAKMRPRLLLKLYAAVAVGDMTPIERQETAAELMSRPAAPSPPAAMKSPRHGNHTPAEIAAVFSLNAAAERVARKKRREARRTTASS